MEKRIRKILISLSFIFLVFPFLTKAANLFTSPVSGTLEVGDRVTVRILVSSDLPINAVSGTLSFPSIFLIESISKSNSILNFWVTEPNFSSGAGTVQFEGVSLGGFSGGTGTVLNVVLKANKEGSGNINFKSGQVLANDGLGTDLTSNLSGSSFIVKPKVFTEKEENKKTENVLPSTSIASEVLNITENNKVTTDFFAFEVDPKLKAPEIFYGRLDQNLKCLVIDYSEIEQSLGLSFNDKLLCGRTEYKDSQILIAFENDQNSSRIFINSKTDSDGNFSITIPASLKSGFYRVWSVVVDDNLDYSGRSNEVIVRVGNIFLDTSMRVRGILFLLLIILLYFIFKNHFMSIKNRLLLKKIKKESREAQDIVRRSFKIINEDVDDVAYRKISTSEREKIKEIKKDLSEAEDIIIKEIKDIEKT